MTRIVPALLLAAAFAACDDSLGPGPGDLRPAYFLSTLDGKRLPTTTDELPQGYTLVSAHLGFDGDHARPRPGDVPSRFVTYSQVVRDPDQAERLGAVDLLYSVSNGVLRIDLCPPLALCIARTELIGPADRDELVLVHYLANQPGAVYRFVAVLPD